MDLPFDIDVLAARCAALPGLSGLTPETLAMLPRKGTSNDHVRLGDSGLVARVPRFSHAGMDAESNRNYQAAAFVRAAPSEHTPTLHHVLLPASGLPGGALIVDFIAGRAPDLPTDMPAIARALAALHSLPLPPPDHRAPLTRPVDPVTATRDAIEQHAVCLADADLAPEALAAIGSELAWAREVAASFQPELSLCLAGADTHPGNFLVDDGGKAWFVDLEKAHYGYAALDLAHASLPTSTGWDPDVKGSLNAEDVRCFYAAYRPHIDPVDVTAMASWLLPLRRLIWLRSMTFFARWRADWSRNPIAGRRDPAMDRHISAHIARCFEPRRIDATRREWLGPSPLSLAG